MGIITSKPREAVLTENNLPDQHGKIFIVTGATGGIGKELASILFAANAKVWITARSEAKGRSTIEDIRSAHPSSQGDLEMLLVDFNDLTTIKSAAEKFLQSGDKLNVLWNNAGIMIPPEGTKTAQGHEAQLGVNVIAPFLFTKLLMSQLTRTAKSMAPSYSPRVVWVSSSAAGRFSPEGGVNVDKLGSSEYTQWQNYGISKAGAILLSAEFARRYGDEGLLTSAVDPGNIDTGLYVHMPRWQYFIASRLALKPIIYGARTELYAGLSPDITREKNGAWVIPWGAMSTPRQDIQLAGKSKAEGGTGEAERLWEWCDSKVAQYL